MDLVTGQSAVKTIPCLLVVELICSMSRMVEDGNIYLLQCLVCVFLAKTNNNHLSAVLTIRCRIVVLAERHPSTPAGPELGPRRKGGKMILTTQYSGM